MFLFGISNNDEELDLQSLYWITYLHKCPYKQLYIAGSSQCSTKTLSILSATKAGFQSYCETTYLRGDMN